MRILSGKALTTIEFIIVPLCYMVLSIVTHFSIVFLRSEFYLIPRPHLFGIGVGIPPIPLLLILLLFAFIPAIYPTPIFFKKRGYENAVIEYEYLKKILYGSTLIFITFVLVSILVPSYYLNFADGASIWFQVSGYPVPYYIKAINNLVFMVLSVPVSITTKLLLEHAGKEFQLYYAKGCFKMVSNKDTDKLDKAKYFRTGLIWYNKFLTKNIGLRINDIIKIYSAIISHSPLNHNRALNSISESFDSEDGLKPLRYILAFIPDKQLQQALTKESMRTTLKESSDLLIPIITVIITIITFFYQNQH